MIIECQRFVCCTTGGDASDYSDDPNPVQPRRPRNLFGSRNYHPIQRLIDSWFLILIGFDILEPTASQQHRQQHDDQNDQLFHRYHLQVDCDAGIVALFCLVVNVLGGNF